MANAGDSGDANVAALRDKKNTIIERNSGSALSSSSPSTSNPDLEPLDYQTSWSSKLSKRDVLSVIADIDIDGDVSSLTFTDATEDGSSDVSMAPAAARVRFSKPLVSAVHTIPRLTSEQIRLLYYSRSERYFFKRQYRLEKMLARQDDSSTAYPDREDMLIGLTLVI